MTQASVGSDSKTASSHVVLVLALATISRRYGWHLSAPVCWFIVGAMFTNLKIKAIEFARRRDIILAGATSRADLLSFIKMLKPYRTDHPLLRFGGSADGGYLVPDDLDGINACFSPGVSTVADFEQDLASRGVQCFLADASVDRPPLDNPLFDFERKFLGRRNDGDYITLESWVSRKAVSGDLLLQMDIEGAEYDVLFSTPSSVLRRFRVIVIEFHQLDRMAHPDFFAYVLRLFEKLTDDFFVAHIHPNNYAGPVDVRGVRVPPIMEFTFLRKDRVSNPQPRSDFPHSLDRQNLTDRPDVVLPPEWYS